MPVLNGWKDIMAYCRVKDIKTIKKRAKVYRMPIFYIFGRPQTTTDLLDEWFKKCEELCKGIKVAPLKK